MAPGNLLLSGPAAAKNNRSALLFAVGYLCLSVPAAAQQGHSLSKQRYESRETQAVLWREPTDMASRNLFYGPGGKKDQPQGTTFAYEKEDLHGTNPKFDVRDQDNVKWRVKLGEEARPETVATRLLWAVGYSTDEDYFVERIQVNGMQAVSRKRRKRMRGLLDSDGTMHDVRLKRHSKDEKKVGTWQWRKNPFTGSRELNGLRVMMAVINNWDLTDENNSIYEEQKCDGAAKQRPDSDDLRVYVVSDVGASFGTAGRVRDRAIAKGNFDSYRRSKFISKIGRDYVDFTVPARESWVLIVNPKEYTRRLRLRWIGRHIPRSDAKWVGRLLARLSSEQVHDAFRAAGYSPEQVDQFSEVVAQRIAELNDL